MSVSSMVKMGLVVGAMAVLTGCSTNLPMTSKEIGKTALYNTYKVESVAVSNYDRIKIDKPIAISVSVPDSERIMNAETLLKYLKLKLVEKEIVLDDNASDKYLIEIISLDTGKPANRDTSAISQNAADISSSMGGSVITGGVIGTIIGNLAPTSYKLTATFKILKNGKELTTASVTPIATPEKWLSETFNERVVPTAASEFFTK